MESGYSGIEVIVGPYRTGKTSILLEQLVARARSNAFAKLMVVVPSARYRALLEARLYELLESWSAGQFASGGSGVFGLRIVPFYRLCRSVLESAGRAVRVVPDAVRPTLVGQVINDMLAQGDLHALGSIARFPGTSAAVLQLIDEFQRAGFSPYQVRVKLEETAAAESRYLDIARIYDRYWTALDTIGYFDRRSLAFAAREILFQEKPAGAVSEEEVPFSSAWCPDFLAVDGFDRIGRLQAQVLLGLSRQARETKVVFDYVGAGDGGEQLPEYVWKRSSFEELLNAFKPAVVTAGHQPPPVPAAPISGDDKAHLKPDPATLPDKRIFSCLDRFIEMQEIARSCKATLLRDRRAASKLLVVARDLKSYQGAIEAAFDEAAIPYFIDESVSLRALPLAQFVLTLVGLTIDDFRRADVLALLRSPYLNLRELGLGPPDIDVLEECSWKENVVGGREQWMNAFADPGDARILNGLERLFDHVTPPATADTLTRFLAWGEDLLERLLRLFAGTGAVDTASFEDSQVVASIRDIVRGLVLEDSILSGRVLPFEIFVSRLETLIDAGNYRRRPQWPDCITICGADLAPNRVYDEVFVAGMIEGEFPRRSGHSGFVGREELSRWSGFGIDLDNPRDHPGFEPALYASLLSRARTRVHLSFPQYEMKGEELVPSFFIAEELASHEPERALPFAASLVDPVSPRDAFMSRLWRCASVDTSGILRDYPGAEYLRYCLEAPLSMVRGRICGKLESVYNGWLVDLVGSGTLTVDLHEKWSASRLNYYGQCPFKYWVSHVLKIRPRPQTQAGVARNDLGSAYHFALELFYKRVVEGGHSLVAIDSDLCHRLLETSAEEALAKLETNSKVSVGDFWEYDKKEFHFRLRRFVAEEIKRAQSDEQGFQPSAFEVAFGGDEPSDNPPLVVASARGPVKVVGKVDRIDLAGDGTNRLVRVVDYKTGSSHISAADALSGRSLQLPIYALAAEQVLLPGSHVTRGVYLSINSGDSVGRLDFDATEGEDFRRKTEQLIAQFVGSIGSGDFTVRPTDHKVCQNCDHRSVCRVGEISGEDQPDEQAD